MSFILDALRKSENERQQQSSNDFAAVPSGRDATPAPRWLWVLGGLLVINVVVVAVLLLRPDSPAPARAGPEPLRELVAESPPDEPSPPVSEAAGEPAFATRLAAARRNHASSPEVTPADAKDAASAATTGNDAPPPAAAENDAPPPAAAVRPGIANLPSLEELQLDGAVDLPPLHIDLHVFNENPARRFVSINMNKYRENERLAEGPVVREITREGVILDYNGKAFALLQ